MPRRLPGLAAVLLAAGALAAPARAEEAMPADLAAALADAQAIEAELVDACARVRRFSVSVIHKRVPHERGRPVEGADPQAVACGSGVLVQKDGRLWVVTNVHVVQGADELEVVTADGETLAVEVHDSIPRYDIALLAFPKRPAGLKGVEIKPAESRDLEVGSWVVATGNPFWLAAADGQSVATLGVVSGKDRILGGSFLYGSAIQHDAEVNPGNSGGPLWNLRGALVGINGMIATRSQSPESGPANTGASFSIPIHQVGEFLRDLIRTRTDAQAGFLGLGVETSTDEAGSADGARVVSVDRRSPARAGSRPMVAGDVITSVTVGRDRTVIHTASDLTNVLAMCPAGTQVKIRYRRGRFSYTWSGRLTNDA